MFNLIVICERDIESALFFLWDFFNSRLTAASFSHSRYVTNLHTAALPTLWQCWWCIVLVILTLLQSSQKHHNNKDCQAKNLCFGCWSMLVRIYPFDFQVSMQSFETKKVSVRVCISACHMFPYSVTVTTLWIENQKPQRIIASFVACHARLISYVPQMKFHFWLCISVRVS